MLKLALYNFRTLVIPYINMKLKANSPHIRLFLLLILFLALGNHYSDAQILIGTKVGARMTWLSFEDDARDEFFESKPHFGYSGGLATAFKVKKRFFLHVDFMYTRKGKRIKGKDDPALNNEAVYHYFSVPILYRVDFKSQIKGTEFKWFAGVGPNIDYWWKGKGSISSSELEEDDIDKMNYKLDFDYDPSLPEDEVLYVEGPNRLQFGLMFAAGLVFEPVPKQTVIVEFRFEWGHSFLAKGSSSYSNLRGYQDDFQARNQGLQLSVSYLFDTNISQRKKGKSTYSK